MTSCNFYQHCEMYETRICSNRLSVSSRQKLRSRIWQLAFSFYRSQTKLSTLTLKELINTAINNHNGCCIIKSAYRSKYNMQAHVLIAIGKWTRHSSPGAQGKIFCHFVSHISKKLPTKSQHTRVVRSCISRLSARRALSTEY